MLNVTGLHSSYGAVEALHGVSLEVARGELVALVGGNGAGKTTLLRCISGVQPVTAGRIVFDGADITRMRPPAAWPPGSRRCRRGGWCSPPWRWRTTSASAATCSTASGCPAPTKGSTRCFPSWRHGGREQAGLFSGGQQQMLAIGRALMSEPRLLLLDEPSMGLAPIVVDQILDAVQTLCANGTTILLVEQNASAALGIADRGYVIETGRMVLDGGGDALLDDPRVQSAYLGV